MITKITIKARDVRRGVPVLRRVGGVDISLSYVRMARPSHNAGHRSMGYEVEVSEGNYIKRSQQFTQFKKAVELFEFELALAMVTPAEDELPEAPPHPGPPETFTPPPLAIPNLEYPRFQVLEGKVGGCIWDNQRVEPVIHEADVERLRKVCDDFNKAHNEGRYT